MGGEARAEMVSEQLGMSKTSKRFIKFLLKRCGNCVFRIECWSQLFPDKGLLIDAYHKVFNCDGIYKGNHKQSFDGKQVVKLINNCANCKKWREHCVVKILDSHDFIGMIEATDIKPRKHIEALERCARCPDNEACWSEILSGLDFGWQSSPQVAWIMTKCKFSRKYEKEGEINGG